MQYRMAAAESGCYEPIVGNVTAGGRRLQTASTAVEVEYRILNPPVKILLMNTTEFSSALAAAPSLQTFAQSVGSSSLEASVVAAPAAAALTSGASQQQGGLPSYAPGAIGGSAAALVVIGAFVASVFYAKGKKKAAKAVAAQKKVVSFQEGAAAAGPSVTPHPLGRGQQQSVRMMFNPINAGSQGGFTD
jgi:hypothetical protein